MIYARNSLSPDFPLVWCCWVASAREHRAGQGSDHRQRYYTISKVY